MNKRLPFLMLMLALLFVSASRAETAVEYMESFSNQYQALQKDMWDYTSSVSHGKSARKVEKRRMELIATAQKALGSARAAKDFGGTTDYRDAVIDFFEIYYNVLNEDYAKIVDMEEIAEQSYDNMEAYMTAKELATDKLMEAGEIVQEAQEKFAKENNITLLEREDDMSRKMEIASKVYDHYNEVYLIFFKSFKQEVYLLDAIGRKDLNAVEQNRVALKATAEEGIEKLKALEPYGGDRSLVDNNMELLKFYIQEADREVPKMTDYFLKEENFMKVKTNFDQIKEKNRTQKDVDTYNQAVNDMNAAVEAYNSANESTNNLRGKYIDSWNRTAQKYTDKHVPK